MAVLETRGLTKQFGRLVAVKDLTLAVGEGEVFGLLGPNGAGKTTAIQMMCGLLKPDAGEVLVHGRRLDSDVRSLVGVCPQQIELWGRSTCLEQLEFMGEMYGVPRAEARRRGEALLEAMGLAEKRHALGRTLSGGMQRRLNLVLALVHDPEIIVLDEPEAGLDPQSRVLVREYIQKLARHKTVILTTHNMDEAERLADRVAIIDRGRLLTLDTPERLKRELGPGDVLEMDLPGLAAESLQMARSVAGYVVPEVSLTGHTLVARALGMVELMPALLNELKRAGVQPGEVRLRGNTLEDVFIALTGRRLRE